MSSLFKKMLTKFLKFPCSSTRWAASFLFPSSRMPIASETVPAAMFTWDTEPPSVYCLRGVGIITLTNFLFYRHFFRHKFTSVVFQYPALHFYDSASLHLNYCIGKRGPRMSPVKL